MRPGTQVGGETRGRWTQFRDQRLSRRVWLQAGVLGVAGLVTALTAACDGGEDDEDDEDDD